MKNDIKSKSRELISNSKIQKALEELIKWSHENDKDLNNSFLLLNARYNSIKRQEALGVVSFTDTLREKAFITNSILESLDRIDLNKPKVKEVKEVSNGKIAKANDKILFLASNPNDTAKLQLEKEFVGVYRSLAIFSGEQYKIVSEWAVTPYELQKAILTHKPKIVHFSGHGMSGKDKGIILQDANGRSKIINPNALTSMFSIFSTKFRMEAVILNACYTEKQAKAISESIPYVIGMSDAINDDTAIEFSTGFYMGLASENDIEFAFELAKNNILLEGLEGDKIPILHRGKK